MGGGEKVWGGSSGSEEKGKGGARVYVYMCIYMCVFICIYICIYIYKYVCVCVCVCIMYAIIGNEKYTRCNILKNLIGEKGIKTYEERREYNMIM